MKRTQKKAEPKKIEQKLCRNCFWLKKYQPGDLPLSRDACCYAPERFTGFYRDTPCVEERCVGECGTSGRLFKSREDKE